MPHLIIDEKNVTVSEGQTVLDACHGVGIEIPTLCYLRGFRVHTSCMVCMVQEKKSNTLIPSCSARATEGMIIETDNEEVREFRKEAIELLLSEHVGSCEGPCELACPFHINIPRMIRQIVAGGYNKAVETIKKKLPFPATVSRICPAPCEKGCRRGRYDQSVSIRLLVRYLADKDCASDRPYIPQCAQTTGKKVAIMGSGPAGLAAAYAILREGHSCVILDARPEPGGMLRACVSETRLPHNVLDKELNVLRALGGEFRRASIDIKDLAPEGLHKDFHAVGLCADDIVYRYKQSMKSYPHIFSIRVRAKGAEGGHMHPGRVAIGKMAAGISVANEIKWFLKERRNARAQQKIFSSKSWHIKSNDTAALGQDAAVLPRVHPKAGSSTGFSSKEAERESKRCLGCDCTARDSCRLRVYATRYRAQQSHFRAREEMECKGIDVHALLTYDPGKCIKCGLCVRIAEKAGAEYGFTFIGKGLGIRIGTPFHHSLSVIDHTLCDECMKTCPTGALAYRMEHMT
ncbi:MAG: 2Fe-2S iron-sulfur cluster-binding protein [bacterium]